MKKIFIPLLSSFILLEGCVPLVIGGAAAGVATGVSVVKDPRSTGTILDNKTLGLALESKISNDKLLYENSHVNVNVYNTTILITGETQSQQIKDQIGILVKANAPKDIKRIANYLIVGEKSSFSNRLFDTKLSTKADAVLADVTVPTFDSSRVKIVAEHSVIFLMGIVSQQEADAIVSVVRRVEGVNQVVTLFEIDQSIADPRVSFKNSTNNSN